VIRKQGNRFAVEEYGVIRTGKGNRPHRLARLDSRLSEIVARLKPELAAVESSFSGFNPKSGLRLAESRGVILSVLGRHGLEVDEFSPAQVKQAVTGFGQAEKAQVGFMVVRLLHLETAPPTDAADAMAVALACLNQASWKSVK
jgi:crossover junction endodeoxyribonuclease RuvC